MYFFFSGHLVLYGRVRQDTNGLGEVMDARVWPSLQRQTDRWERHGELWQNSGRHHQESIRGLCFPLRNLFQQQSLPWLQDYFYMVQKKRENGSKWTLSTYIPLHWAYEIEAWVGNFIQITVFFQPKSRVCASVCRNTERSIYCRFKQTQNSCANRKQCYEIGNANYVLYCEPRSAKL